MSGTKRKWIFTIILVAIEVFLTVTNLGYYTIGSTAFTVLHIPIFIATIMIGLPQGVLIAAIFGGSSMISAYLFNNSATTFLFQDPRISVIPRLMIPFAVWIAYKAVCYIADDHTLSAREICSGSASVAGVIANAAFVISAVAIVAPQAIGITDSLSASTMVVTKIIAVNIVFEIIAAVAVTSLTVLVVYKFNLLGDVPGAGAGAGPAGAGAEAGAGVSVAAGEDAGVAAEAGSAPAPEIDKPIKKTFRKWLFLIMSLTFFFMLIFLYYLFTKQDQKNADILLYEKSGDITRLVENSGLSVNRQDLTIGNSGFVTIADDDLIIITGLRSLETGSLSSLVNDWDELPQDEVCGMTVNGVPGSGIINKVDDYAILSFVPDTEIFAERDRTLSILLGGLLVLFLVLFAMISTLVERNVVQKIQDVNESLSQIRAGNLDERVTAAGNNEFEELSFGINTTVDALKDTMREIAEKNRAELEFAREVQTTALPPAGLTGRGKCGFEILGSMQPAKEVGGDFYDYFMIGEDRLGFVIADVSGKGIPAALFMMRATTLINNFVMEGKSPAEALQRANVELCENNDKGMFVTVWLGILELQTGRLEFANAAHNPPLLKKNGEPFVYMDHKIFRRGLVLAGLPEMQYRNNEISLGAGDILFLYTDGVTEAANPKYELYGEQRLLACIEANYELEPAELIRAVRADIDAFAAGMEQYDDITMVVLKLV